MTTVEFAHNSEELLHTLADRITELEQFLVDDEDFCNKDLDATYQIALKYVQRLQNQFGEKLNELKNKLDRLREENVNVSKQNKKLFDDQIEIINQLFFSGKHQQGWHFLQKNNNMSLNSVFSLKLTINFNNMKDNSNDERQ